MKNIWGLLFLLLFIQNASASALGGHNTFFIAADCGDFVIGNPSRGANPFMQNTIYGIIIKDTNDKQSFHNLSLSVHSNWISLDEKMSPQSHGIQIEFNKVDVFSDLPSIKGLIKAKSGPYAGETSISCSIRWTEVIGSKIIFHPSLEKMQRSRSSRF